MTVWRGRGVLVNLLNVRNVQQGNIRALVPHPALDVGTGKLLRRLEAQVAPYVPRGDIRLLERLELRV
jgi:hypothetical protein